MEKQCRRCLIQKSLTEFPKSGTWCRECKRVYNLNWRVANRGRIRGYDAKYAASNREKVRVRRRKVIRKYMNKRRKLDLNFRLAGALRSRLWSAIRNNSRKGSAVRDLGCSIPELRVYLESKFTAGMTWENYGEWHIDHIKPLISFNLIDYAQLAEACHYTNLQPLWAKDNMAKGCKLVSRIGYDVQ
jgi:hypothetical protein